VENTLKALKGRFESLVDPAIIKARAAAEAELRRKVEASYQEQTDVRYAAARLWVDGLIDPAQTREALVWALEAAALNPDVAAFRTGVLQT